METIGLATVKQYHSGVISLFKEQQTMRINSHPHPGEDLAVVSLMKTVARNENARKRAEYVDRGTGTLRDGYHDFQALSEYFYLQNSELALRNRYSFDDTCCIVFIDDSIQSTQSTLPLWTLAGR